MNNISNASKTDTLVKVIGMLGITAYILFPKFAHVGYNRPLDSGHRCQTNLKQLGEAFKSYLADYDDVLPSSALRGVNTWDGQEFTKFATLQGGPDASPTIMSILRPYVDFNIAWCPDDPMKKDSPDAVISYWYKAANDKAWFNSFRKDSDYRRPDRQVLMYEHTGWHHENTKNGLANGVQINFLYMDGHVVRRPLNIPGNSHKITTPSAPGEPAWYDHDFVENRSFRKRQLCNPNTQGDTMG